MTLSSVAQTEDNEIEKLNVIYRIDNKNKKASVVGYIADTTVIKVLNNIRYNQELYPVVSIGKSAFKDCALLETITIPNNVTSINSEAFAGCVSLKNVKIPAKVSHIAGDAIECDFEIVAANPYFTVVDNILFSKDMKKLIRYPKNKTDLAYSIPESVNIIEEGAFTGCENIEQINIPETVAVIRSKAFSGCTKLKTVVIPDKVTTIEKGTFSNCKSLESITIPTSVSSIGNSAFSGCTNLKSVKIPDNVKYLGGFVFMGCRNLQSVNIPKRLTVIKNSTFANCSNLKQISIPIYVKNIEDRAFKDCSSLQMLDIPKNVEKIGNGVFDDCDNLQKVCYHNPSLTKLRKIDPAIFVYVKDPPTSWDNLVAQAKDYFDKNNRPELSIVPNSVKFVDPSGNNIIDAEEDCMLYIDVTNSGTGDALACEAVVDISESINDVEVENVRIEKIAAGSTMKLEIPIKSGMNTINGEIFLTVEVTEPNGFGAPVQQLSITTKEFTPPSLYISKYSVNKIENQDYIYKVEQFTIEVELKNDSEGIAEDVKIEISHPVDGVHLLSGNKIKLFDEIKGRETKKIEYEMIVNNNYKQREFALDFKISEKYGLYAKDKTIVLSARTKSDYDGIDPHFLSDVDKDIPVSDVVNYNTYALIIANQNYENVEHVPFALNDGRIFKEYCIKTLGIPESNILMVEDATTNKIISNVEKTKKNVNSHNGEAKLIFYYAGHGIPDKEGAYLLPCDGDKSIKETAYSLDRLYDTLGNCNAQSITYFVDACFSGTKRDGSSLEKGTRSVSIKSSHGMPLGNAVLFAAASSDQVAYSYDKHQHGMFTYYLLKKIKETRGDISYDSLLYYIEQNVSKSSQNIYETEQKPNVIPSRMAGQEWMKWRLR